MRAILVITMILTACTAGLAGQSEQDALIQAFEETIPIVFEPAMATPVTNESGGIAWGRSYQLSALVEMLDLTRDPKYADLFIALGRQVADQRDSVRSLQDEIRNEIVPAWGSTKYSGGKNYAWAVHTGMIAEPMARFASVVRGDPQLVKDYSKAADYFVRIAERAMAVHDDQWRTGPSEDEGHIYGMWLKKPLPLNQQNAPGRAYIYLHDATGNQKYLDRATELARFMKRRLRTTDDGAYVWDYWAPLEGSGQGFEDISHAAINVDFMVVCNEHSVVFTDDDIARLAKTLTTKVIQSDSEVANSVGGGGGTNAYARQIFRWAGLARHSDAGYHGLMSLYRSEEFAKVTDGGPDPVGIALLAAATGRAGH